MSSEKNKNKLVNPIFFGDVSFSDDKNKNEFSSKIEIEIGIQKEISNAKESPLTDYIEAVLISDILNLSETETKKILTERGTEYKIHESKESLNITPIFKYIKHYEDIGYFINLDEVGYSEDVPFFCTFPNLDVKILNNESDSFLIKQIKFKLFKSKVINKPLPYIYWNPKGNGFQPLWDKTPIEKGGSAIYGNNFTLKNDSWTNMSNIKINFDLIKGNENVNFDILNKYSYELTINEIKSNTEYIVDLKDVLFQKGVNVELFEDCYNNESRENALNVYKEWLEKFEHEIPSILDLPLYKVIKDVSDAYASGVFNWYIKPRFVGCGVTSTNLVAEFLQNGPPVRQKDGTILNFAGNKFQNPSQLPPKVIPRAIALKLYDLLKPHWGSLWSTNPDFAHYKVVGIIEYQYTDENGKLVTTKNKFVVNIPLFDIWGRGAYFPEAEQHFVEFNEQLENYEVIISENINRYLKSKEIERFNFRIGCKKPSIHEFVIEFELSNGKVVESKPINLEIFTTPSYYNNMANG